MRTELTSIDRTATGLVLHFQPDPGLEAALEQLVVEEKGCCQFWGFEIIRDDALTLRWDGPMDAQPLLDELFRRFEGGSSRTALRQPTSMDLSGARRP